MIYIKRKKKFFLEKLINSKNIERLMDLENVCSDKEPMEGLSVEDLLKREKERAYLCDQKWRMEIQKEIEDLYANDDENKQRNYFGA